MAHGESRGIKGSFREKESPEGATDMARTYTHLLIHALFSTSHRQPMLDAELKSELFAYMIRS